MAKSFNQAASELTDIFPNISLTDFDGVNYPVTVNCPIHGNVRYSTFNALIKSKYGCPECAKMSKTQTPPNVGKPLLILDTTTNETLTFPSVTAAGAALGVHFQQINHRLKGRTSPDNLISNRYKVLGYDR